MKKGNRWVQLAVGTGMLMFSGFIYGWSLFKNPLNELFPQWTLSQLSLTFTISMIFAGVGGFCAGNLSKKHSPRYILMLSALMLLVGFQILALSNPDEPQKSLLILYACYGVIASTGVGFSYNNVISTVSKWFPDKLGFAYGVMMMGFGLGALFLGGIAISLIDKLGVLKAFRVLGIMLFLVMALGSLILTTPEKGKEDKGNLQDVKGMTTKEMISSSSFWAFILWAIISNTAIFMVVNSAASIAMAFGATAIVGMVVSVFNGIGRVSVGTLYDKLGRRKTMLINTTVLFLGGIALIVGAKQSEKTFILMGLICVGFAFGGNPPISSSYIRHQYGEKCFPVNFSIGNFSTIPSSIAGPMLSSMLITNSGGKYESTFISIIICAAVSLVLLKVIETICKKSDAENLGI